MLAKTALFQENTTKYYIESGELKINTVDSGSNEREYCFDADDFYENWNEKGLTVAKDGTTCFGCKADNKKYFKVFSSPPQTLIQKWLREKHNIHIKVDFFDTDDGLIWDYAIYDLKSPFQDDGMSEKPLIEYGLYSDREFKTYEHALEKGLQEALKLIK